MTTGKTHTGGCGCGAIRYEFSGEPDMAVNCHCRDCQYHSGSAFASFAVVPSERFQLLQGEPKYYDRVSDAGVTVRRGFCPDCGAPVLILEPARPKVVYVHAASLDDAGSHRPEMNMFTQSAQPWDVLDTALKEYPLMPPMPEDFGR